MKAIVIGAGIGGLTTAVALRRRGIEVEVYEAGPQWRDSGTGLGLASNATKVLDALGVDLSAGSPLEYFSIRTTAGKQLRELPIGAITAELGSPIVNIHRTDLIATLRAAAGDTPIRLGARLSGYTRTGDGVTALFEDGTSAHGDVLIGADGIGSQVRAQVAGAAPVTEHGYVCWLATVPFSDPRLPAGHANHYWGRGVRFGLIDIGGGRVYWWGTKNLPVEQARTWNGGKDAIATVFAGWAPEVTEVIDRTPDAAIHTVPAQDRPFLEVWGDGPVTLLGDAAHPMLTSLSQGGSSSVEDAYVLAHHLASDPDPLSALRGYENARRDRTRMLVAQSRKLSTLEQIQNPAVVRLRDAVIRVAPMSVLRKQNLAPMRFDLPVEQFVES
ncbi:FAD-dependent monooxygenase [Nocardia jejuensis]|uniref:FAD-dependent monooxygenase n=1 Tax=Nocardia jejuensis TaxID=328049 RepID=UPI00082C425D|nr:FAD-dependent monooxygenase [Nocardia jejuensis]